jgi:hypothetical protein
MCLLLTTDCPLIQLHKVDSKLVGENVMVNQLDNH